MNPAFRSSLVPGALLCVLYVSPGWCQKPIIAPRGVVNAASMADAAEYPLGPGSVATILGANLSRETIQAAGFPLLRRLGGVSVAVDGIPAPLLLVSPAEIRLQVPSGLLGNVRASVAVSAPGGSSNVGVVKLASTGLGVFTQDGTQCGPGQIFHQDSKPVTPENSASPGEILQLFGTGFGLGYFFPDDGEPSPGNPALRPITQSGILVPRKLSRSAPPRWPSGGVYREPGLVGVDAVIFMLDPDAAEGCAIPLRAANQQSSSQPVTLSVRQGGGLCDNPPPERTAQLRWVRRVTFGARTPAVEDRLEAQFVQSRGLVQEVAAVSGIGLGACRCEITALRGPGPECPGFEAFTARGFGVGPLIQKAPGRDPVTVSPSDVSGPAAYSVTLPANTIRPGDFEVEAGGGSEVGSFHSSGRVGSPLELTTGWTPYTVFPSDKSIPVTWKGGDPESEVRVRIAGPATYAIVGQGLCECVAPASAGSVALPPLPGQPSLSGTSIPPRQVIRPVREITVSVGPKAAQTFTADGLSLAGQHTWAYEYSFHFGSKAPPPRSR